MRGGEQPKWAKGGKELIFLVDNFFTHNVGNVRVMGIPEVMTQLRKHLFNDQIWPDFTKLPKDGTPILVIEELEEGVSNIVGDLEVTPVPGRRGGRPRACCPRFKTISRAWPRRHLPACQATPSTWYADSLAIPSGSRGPRAWADCSMQPPFCWVSAMKTATKPRRP